jgi:hypothetical protein
MKPGFPVKSAILVFAVVVVLYAAAYWGIERWRNYQGPWQVTFQVEAQSPVLAVAQPHLGIADVRLVFRGETVGESNLPAHVTFDRPLQRAAFGRVIYEDLTSLPGIVTFNLFDHAVELMPRTLVVNGREVPWRRGLTLELWPTNKPPEKPMPPKGRNR